MAFLIPSIQFFFGLPRALFCAGDKIEKNEMDGTCSTYRGEEGRIQGFGGRETAGEIQA